MATTYCYYTQTTPTDNNKWTLSMWVKRAELGTVQNLVGAWDDGSNHCIFRFNADNQLDWYDYQAPASFQLKTNRVFRDVGAWYHLVFVWDSDNVTEADRMQTWVNGVRETSYATSDYPTSGASTVINVSGRVVEIGRRSDGGYFSGEMSHVQFVDGLALAPTEFGSVDATSGIWKIKTACYATPGNNGICLKMEDRTNLDLDSSSNAFTFTTSGTLTATYDNPSDNFCTLNPLHLDNITKTNGNTTATTAADAVWRSTYSTLGDEVGKYYYEAKCVTQGTYTGIGFATIDNMQAVNGNNNFLTTGGYGYVEDGRKNNQSTESAYGTSYTTGDIIGVAFNMTDGNMWFSKNGTWQNSATIGEIAANTTTNAAFAGITTGKTYIPAARFYNSTVWSFNFGNGYFGTTAITSAGTNASSIGSFEYDVPTNFTALSTKGLNE